MKFAEPRPYTAPEAAAARLLEIAKTLRNDKGHLPVGEWNGTFLKGGVGNVAEYTASRDKLINDGVIQMHGSGSIFMFTPEGAHMHLREA
jgi:hypothetical protein